MTSGEMVEIGKMLQQCVNDVMAAHVAILEFQASGEENNEYAGALKSQLAQACEALKKTREAATNKIIAKK